MLDLTQSSSRIEEAIGWLARAIAARLTTADRLRDAMTRRARVRWRGLLHAALLDIGDGSHSLLELAYLRSEERAHGTATQRAAGSSGRRPLNDALYPEYCTRMELDGRAAHPQHERWRDHRRDNDAVEQGDRPLRYGIGDVADYPCDVAAQVVSVLRLAGWTGIPTACDRPDCRFRAP